MIETDRRTRLNRHALNADGMVACNPRDREAVHRARVEDVATGGPDELTCATCRRAL